MQTNIQKFQTARVSAFLNNAVYIRYIKTQRNFEKKSINCPWLQNAVKCITTYFFVIASHCKSRKYMTKNK